MNNLLELIKWIDPDSYEDWLIVGMALKHEGYSVGDWDLWSQSSTKYKSGVCEKKWESFNEQNAGTPVTGGTIYKMAQERGYRPQTSDRVIGWDDEIEEIGRDYQIVEAGFVKPETIPEAGKSYRPLEDLREYLNEMFHPDEYVGYCDRLEQDEKGRWVPKNGITSRTAGQLLKALKSFSNASICPESEGGALIRFNPLDGSGGERDANVTAYRYALVESDTDSIEKQYALIKAMNLPVKFLIHSGNKSIHAIIHIDAESLQQYRERVNFLYEFCKKNGLQIDTNDKNASRYSRMPGIKRNGKFQRIIDRNIGAANYKEWREWADAENDNLPDCIQLGEVLDDLPPLKDELISGILRVGHKLLLSGPSKAGKSFLLMSLAVALAEGTDWLGHKCRQGNVLYVNLELDEASTYHRFDEIYRRLGIRPDHANSITLWNLRGRAVPMDKLTPFLIRRIKGKGYIAVVIDPIYKVITGDENDATQMSQFCSYFDRVAIEADVAMIYCHHHSKGANQKYSNSVDRASGSGVFARDPDAILDLTQLKLDGEEIKYKEQVPDACQTLTAWEMSGTLREFPPMAEERIWFDYPIHRSDEWNFLATAKYSGAGSKGVGKDQVAKEDASEIISDVLDGNTFDANEAMSLDDMIESSGLSEPLIKRRTRPDSNFELGTIENGTRVIFRRGHQMILFRGVCYQRPARKNDRWKP
ncbi:MAG: AAA family ATPase [Ruminococcus sp.]|nr:AAA family ATPase [Ruminococcus sp.]